MVGALPLTLKQQQIAAAARSIKIYVYDPAAGDVQPPLTAFAADSQVCQDSCHPETHNSGTIDLCNNGFGRPAPATFASALQGHVWTNHDYGHDVAPQVRTSTLLKDTAAEGSGCTEHCPLPLCKIACSAFACMSRTCGTWHITSVSRQRCNTCCSCVSARQLSTFNLQQDMCRYMRA